MKSLSALATAALLTAAPALAQTVEIETARGPAEVPLTLETVIVFDIPAVDTLDALGVEVAGVPDRTFVSYLDDVAESAEVAGTLFEPDLEAINAMQPDLVIVGGRSSEQYGTVSDMATTIDMTIDGGNLVEDSLARLEAYGAIFGKEDEAQALKEEFNAKLEQARAAVGDAGTGLILMTNGPKISAYGAGSRFGWFHEALGLEPAAGDVEAADHGEAVSFEFVRDANPDWLLVLDRAAAIGAEGDRAEQTLDNELVAETTAWQQEQVVYLNPAETYIAGGGIQSMMGTLDQVIEAFGGADS